MFKYINAATLFWKLTNNIQIKIFKIYTPKINLGVQKVVYPKYLARYYNENNSD